MRRSTSTSTTDDDDDDSDGDAQKQQLGLALVFLYVSPSTDLAGPLRPAHATQLPSLVHLLPGASPPWCTSSLVQLSAWT